MSKTTIVVLSDPKGGSEEALGRVFNALFLALELKDKGQEVALVFQGAGARWPGELSKLTHPANALFETVRGTVVGVCGGCADVFGATETVQACDLPLVRDKAIPGTGGILDLSRYLDQGYRLLTF
jgi:hypothetical protein